MSLVLFEFWTSYEQSISWERKPPKHPLETVGGSRGASGYDRREPLFLEEAFEPACWGLQEDNPLGPWVIALIGTH